VLRIHHITWWELNAPEFGAGGRGGEFQNARSRLITPGMSFADRSQAAIFCGCGLYVLR